MSGFFIQGAGGRETFARLRGACLSRHSRKRELRISTCESGSSKAYTIFSSKTSKSLINASRTLMFMFFCLLRFYD